MTEENCHMMSGWTVQQGQRPKNENKFGMSRNRYHSGRSGTRRGGSVCCIDGGIEAMIRTFP